MAGTKEAQQRAGYTELAKAEQTGDFERGLKTANRMLKSWPNAKEAFAAKVVCLIQLGKFADCLGVIKKGPPKCQAIVQFEKAYCEYREGQAETALATLDALGDSLPPHGRELQAQLLYRLERFGEAKETYQKLLKETADEFDDLRTVNLQAVEVHLLGSSGASLIQPDPESYQQLYNEACRLLGLGNWEPALRQLRQAEKLCREELAEDDVPEDEVEEEVAVLRAQTAFALQQMGKTEEATAIYQELVAAKTGDSVVTAVAATNLVALRGGEAGGHHLFDTRKKLKAASAAAAESKLSPAQKQIATYNNALLQLLSNQFEPCRKGINDLRGTYGAEEDATVLEVALLIRQKETGNAVKVAEAYQEKVGEEAFPTILRFALAQLHLIEGNSSSAESSLEAVPNAAWSLGPLSLRIALRLAADQNKEALSLLSSALTHYKKAKDDAALTRLTEEAASLNLRLGKTKEASSLLEELRRRKPEDPAVLASLIHAYAKFNPAKAEEVSESLVELGDAGLFGDAAVDAAALESEGAQGLGLAGGKSKGPRTKDTPIDAEKAKEKKKKKRKPRLPKNFDPAVPPDPERWLPRYERSNVRRRKDKRKADREIGRGAQGAVSGAAEALDMSAKSGAPVPSSPKQGAPAGTSPAMPTGPRQQRPGGQAKTKKKPAKKGGRF